MLYNRHLFLILAIILPVCIYGQTNSLKTVKDHTSYFYNQNNNFNKQKNHISKDQTSYLYYQTITDDSTQATENFSNANILTKKDLSSYYYSYKNFEQDLKFDQELHATNAKEISKDYTSYLYYTIDNETVLKIDTNKLIAETISKNLSTRRDTTSYIYAHIDSLQNNDVYEEVFADTLNDYNPKEQSDTLITNDSTTESIETPEILLIDNDLYKNQFATNKDYTSKYFMNSDFEFHSGQVLVSDTNTLTNYKRRQFGMPVEFIKAELNDKAAESELIQVSEKHTEFPDWVLIVLILTVILIIWSRYFYRKYVSSLTNIFSFTALQRMIRERNTLSDRVGFILYLNYIFSLALLILFILKYFQVNIQFWSYWKIYLVLVGIIPVVYIVKRLITIMLANLFKFRKPLIEYFYSNYILFQLSGIVLVPLLFLIAYIPSSYTQIIIVYVAVFILILLYLFRILRLFKIIIQKHFSIFYLFLYLCTVEIFPVLLIIKYYMLSIS